MRLTVAAEYPVFWNFMIMTLTASAKLVGVTYKATWEWWKAGQLAAFHLPMGTVIVREPVAPAHTGGFYARVSTADHKDDAAREMERLRECEARGYPMVSEVIESASGLNDECLQLKKPLANPKVGVLEFERRNRLTRVGSGSVATLLEQQGSRMEAIYLSDTEDDLRNDVVAVSTSIAPCSYDRRHCRRQAEWIKACSEQDVQKESDSC